MRNDTNEYGLTFEDWVCAAGVARFNRYGTVPYTYKGFVHYPRYIRNLWRQGVDPSEVLCERDQHIEHLALPAHDC